MSKLKMAFVIIGILVAMLPLAHLRGSSQEAGETTADREAIQSLAEAYVAAYDAGDAKALGALWTVDGDYVDANGQQFNARELIERDFAERRPADAAKHRLKVTVKSRRFITKNVVIEDGTSEFEPSFPTSAPSGRYTAIYVKRDGKWLLDSVREAAMPSDASAQSLAALQWMIGDWVGHDDQRTVYSSAEWSENGRFIVKRFEIHEGESIVLTGTQRIGWDPRARQIRSWFFGSHGGYGEGVWTSHGDQWIVRATGTAETGQTTSLTNVYTQVDENAFLRRIMNLQVGAEVLPDVELKMVRKPIDR